MVCSVDILRSMTTKVKTNKSHTTWFVQKMLVLVSKNLGFGRLSGCPRYELMIQ